MRFVLPLHAHNLPLLHRRETKLMVALKGGLDIRAGRRRIALLEEDEAIKLDTGIAYRIHQYGPVPGTVGQCFSLARLNRSGRQSRVCRITGLISA